MHVARPNIPLDITRIVIEGAAGAKPWVNTFWLQTPSSGTPTGTQMNALAHSFLVAFEAMWKVPTASGASCNQCLAEWNDGNGNMVVGTDATLQAGTQTSGLSIASISMVLSWRLSARYRGGHPRTYLAGLDVSQFQDNATYKSTSVSAVQSAANTFLAAIDAIVSTPFTSVTLGVLRQFANGGSEAKPKVYLTPPVFKPYTSVVVKPGIATQRRRLGDNFN